MVIDPKMASGFGVALNEATLIGAEYDPQRNLLGTTFSILTLPDDHSPEPEDPRVQIIFSKIGRVAAALRNAFWNKSDAATIPFEISDLLQIVQSFGGQPIYGWDFVNVDDPEFRVWEKRFSLDFITPNGSTENRINLFQESSVPERHLDLWIWFSGIQIRSPDGKEITVEDFIADGDRWWRAMNSGDERTSGHGIVPGS